MALSLLEKVFFLKSVSLFEHIPGEEIVGIVPILLEVEIEPGVTFIRKGEEGDCLYIIVEGEVIASMEGGIERGVVVAGVDRRAGRARRTATQRRLLGADPRRRPPHRQGRLLAAHERTAADYHRSHESRRRSLPSRDRCIVVR